MKLTPFAKFFITVVILGVIGYVLWHYKGGDVRTWAGAEKSSSSRTASKSSGGVTSDDFNALRSAPPDPERGKGAAGVAGTTLAGSGKLGRPLVVAINTWAGHAPGIVAASGMETTPTSRYRQTYGLDVKFVLLEDPAAKLAAFRKGDVDIMWNTVDNWAREASILAEQNQKAKSVVMQDWSRGGDGIVSLASIKSIEELKGHKISCTQFTPSHFLLLYLLAQSGLSPEDRAIVE
jgi:ABC-type nitrate/sulfonate/bicarbonate transport system substrate-binding protein